MSNKITLYFLQASRSIRTAWQLSELDLDYNLQFSNRNEKSQAPAEAKQAAGGLGKFPSLEDDGVFLYESGNICEYLCDKYDPTHRLLPAPGDPQRYRILQWVHAAEATYALHALAVLYARWFQQDGNKDATEAALSANVVKDFDYLEAELSKGSGSGSGSGSGKFLCGRDAVSAADIMMQFSVDFIFARQLGTKGKSWPRVERWLEDCKATPSYRRAVEKTGHRL